MSTANHTSPAQPRINYRAASPAGIAGMIGLQQAVNQSGLEPALMELVKLRASQMNGCAFCIDMHFREAKQKGERDERLYLLNAWREAAVYTPRERAALEWTEALTVLAPHGVSDEIYAAVRGEFSEQELVNLTLAIVAINGWNRISIGFRVPPGTKF